MGLPFDKLLAAGAAGLATVLAGVTVTQAVSEPKTQAFRTLDVQRVNLREADGTLRLVMAGKSSFPGIIWRGKDYPHPGRNDAAGWIFLNDEGTENGGLIWGARKGPDGKVSGFGHLSFDQYEQDQVVVLEQSEDAGARGAALTIQDRPDYPMQIAEEARVRAMPEGPEKAKALAALDKGNDAPKRLTFGKEHSPNGQDAAGLVLSDATGKSRLRVLVQSKGEPSIQFLDANGKPVRTITSAGG